MANGPLTPAQLEAYEREGGLLTSIFIAVDPATTENGCLQIIPGSHPLGRIDHVLTGDQAGADPVRVDAILQRSPCNTSRCNPATSITRATHHSDSSARTLTPLTDLLH